MDQLLGKPILKTGVEYREARLGEVWAIRGG